MNKKELEKMREKLKAENPFLTEEQIEDIIAESENGASGEDSESGKSVPETPNPLLVEREALAKEKEALEAEREALAKEKEALEAEKEALAKEKEALAEEKAALLAEKEALLTDAPQARGKSAGSDNGKAVTYECKTRCTFGGQYYREGDSLTTSETVPDFFQAVQEGA